MKRLVYAFAAVLLLGAPARAEVGPKQLVINLANPVIATTALDASSSSFSWTQPSNQGAFGLLMVYVQLTDADDSCTAITMSCTSARTNMNSGNVYTLQSCTTASGVCTSSDSSWVKDASGNTSSDIKRWVWRVDIEGLEDGTCTFTDTAGAAADSIRVDAAFATKGS